MHRITAALTLALAAGAVSAQSMNIDFNATSGFGVGVPVASFGGPAAQPGVWNNINSSSPAVVTLSALDGAPTAATLNRATNGTFSSANSASTTGDREKLMDDYQTISGDTMVFTFNNLENGMYAVYITAAHPTFTTDKSIVNIPSPAYYCSPTEYVGGAIPSTGYVAGVTHSVHTKDVIDGHMTVNIAGGAAGAGVISGLQIVKLPDYNHRVRIYVDTNAAGASDGGSWASAFTDLQAALAAADLGGGIHFEVWVANGFYYPGTTRDATFSVTPGLAFYGGFAGSETTLAQRTAPLFNMTYLSGAIGAATTADNCYTVVTLAGATSNTTVDGFYIVRGNNNDTGYGGGMSITSGGSCTIRNCSFSSNQASQGGGALALTSSSVLMANCTFYNNEAYNGVGGAIRVAGPVAGTLTLNNSRLLGNYALGEGGAIHVSNCSANITGCLFSGNTSADEGGAVYGTGTGRLINLVNTTLSKNASPLNTGGVYVTDGMDLEFHNSIFWGNTGGLGGALTVQQFAAYAPSGSGVTATYNTVQGQNLDPLFVNALGADGIAGTFDDDCRLRQHSLCIDAGDAARLPLDYGDSDGNGVWNETLPVDNDLNPRRIEITSVADTGPGASPVVDRGCYEFQLDQWCYANCDNSILVPVLNVQDFACFLNKFAAGDAYANCDNSTVAPTLNVQDFSCFLNKFAAGCP